MGKFRISIPGEEESESSRNSSNDSGGANGGDSSGTNSETVIAEDNSLSDTSIVGSGKSSGNRPRIRIPGGDGDSGSSTSVSSSTAGEDSAGADGTSSIGKAAADSEPASEVLVDVDDGLTDGDSQVSTGADQENSTLVDGGASAGDEINLAGRLNFGARKTIVEESNGAETSEVVAEKSSEGVEKVSSVADSVSKSDEKVDGGDVTGGSSSSSSGSTNAADSLLKSSVKPLNFSGKGARREAVVGSGEESEAVESTVGKRRKKFSDDDFVDVDASPDVSEDDVDEDFFNPLLEDDEEEFVVEEFAGGVRSSAGEEVLPVRETVVVVPDSPSVPADVAKNLERKNAGREKPKRASGSVGDKTPGKPLEKLVAVEVNVGVDGSERGGASSSSKTGIRDAGKLKSKARDEEREVVDLVEVRSPAGGDKWVVRGEQGRMKASELELFTNLSRGKSSRDDREEMREVFARIDGNEKTDEAEKARRKTVINRAVFGEDALRSGNRRRFTEKDRDTLRFIGMFKYANARHIGRIFQVTEKSMLKRLRALEKQGFVVRKDVFGARPLWYLTENGLIVSGLDLPRIKESGITWTMLPHQFVVNHTAGNLWGGGVNVLSLEDFPEKNRVNEKGEQVFGEELVSEFEIQSAFAKIKQTHKADTYRPIITGERDKLFAKWKRNGGPEFGPSPEMLEGNEYLWCLIPPAALRLAYHVPDLVVKRPRAADGRPESIAVEVELANKPYHSYERSLEAYKYDSLLYKKVVWVVKSRGAARKIEEAAVKLDMWDDERVDITPIYTEEGVFKGKAEWTI